MSSVQMDLARLSLKLDPERTDRRPGLRPGGTDGLEGSESLSQACLRHGKWVCQGHPGFLSWVLVTRLPAYGQVLKWFLVGGALLSWEQGLDPDSAAF